MDGMFFSPILFNSPVTSGRHPQRKILNALEASRDHFAAILFHRSFQMRRGYVERFYERGIV
jgi:hypothetical protein